jgi:hypothetical protein
MLLRKFCKQSADRSGIIYVGFAPGFITRYFCGILLLLGSWMVCTEKEFSYLSG